MNNEYGMMKSWIVSLVLVLGSLATVAGDDVFTVATLNVDGLPSYIGGIHINPDVGSRLKLESHRLETDYTYDDGTPMGDHYPVSATFSFVDEPSSGISGIQPVTASEFYSVEGRRRFSLQRGLNIVRTADGRVRKVVKK